MIDNCLGASLSPRRNTGGYCLLWKYTISKPRPERSSFFRRWPHVGYEVQQLRLVAPPATRPSYRPVTGMKNLLGRDSDPVAR